MIVSRRSALLSSLATGAVMKKPHHPQRQGATAMPASTPSTVRATVQANGTSPGDPATVLVDGADTQVTANGLQGYIPKTGDRLLVLQVGGQVEILQFITRQQIVGQSFITAPSGQRWEIKGGSDTGDINTIAGFSGNPSEVSPAKITTQYLGGPGALSLRGPDMNGGGPIAEVQVLNDGTATGGTVALLANKTVLTGTLQAQSGNPISLLGCGTVSATTSATGVITVTHGLGAGPLTVFATSVGAGGTTHYVATSGYTSTQFTATVRNITAGGAVVASTAVTLRWFAIG